MTCNGLPPEQGLYDPRHEHDACGIGFVANIKGRQSHDIILKGIQILINLTHRGACGCDPETGDGAGILIQIPHEFFARECRALGFTLPGAGRIRRRHGLPPRRTPAAPAAAKASSNASLAKKASKSSAGATRPIDGRRHRPRGPRLAALHPAGLHRPHRPRAWTTDELERKLYIVRKRAETEVAASRPSPIAATSTSPRSPAAPSSIKGLLLAPQIANFYPELSDPDVSARSAWCTSASPPTRFPPGSSPTPSATSPTTAKSTPFAATSTGCTPARPSWPLRSSATISRSSSRSSSPTAATPLASTMRSNCSYSAAGPCPTPWPC